MSRFGSDPFGRVAEHMKLFHNGFRRDFSNIYDLADSYKDNGMSLPRYLQYASSLYEHLEMHHKIEETYIFPILAKKMDVFKANSDHEQEHAQMHKVLQEYDTYIKDCLGLGASAEKIKFESSKFRGIMDDLKNILFKHLDHEEHSLSGPEMKKFWTLDELKQIPM